MAKDDYDVLVFKILTYYYACMKRKILFNQDVFNRAVKCGGLNDDYFADVLRMMQDESLIQGLEFTKAWGGDYILTSELSCAKITPGGIHYLKENGIMQKVMKSLIESADTIGNLAGIVGLAK